VAGSKQQVTTERVFYVVVATRNVDVELEHCWCELTVTDTLLVGRQTNTMTNHFLTMTQLFNNSADSLKLHSTN